MTTISRIGDLSMQWGESIRWDDKRERLCFVDCASHLVTGTLNLMEGPGSYWWFSAASGWRMLDDGSSNRGRKEPRFRL